MEKRLAVAIGLSILVLMVWSAMVPKPQPIDIKQVTENLAEKTVASEKIVLPAITSKEIIKFKQINQEIVFVPSLGAIDEVIFQNKLEHHFPLKIGLSSDFGLLFKLQSVNPDSIIFIHESKERRVVKKFKSNPDNTIELEITTHNLSANPITIQPQLNLGILDLSNKNPQARFQDILIATNEKNMHVPAGKNFTSPDLKFAGLRDQYFCLIVQPKNNSTKAYIKKLNGDSQVGIIEKEVIINPNSQIGHSYRIYFGPQDIKMLNSLNPDWTSIIHFGFFDFIAQLLLQLLNFLYGLVHNWGWAIILLSIAVYFILFPLSIKQMRSMKEMQVLQPKIEALRKEYKDNPQKLNKEVMELYREHKVNPLSGCLPLILQMPIFFALYQALIRSAALRGADFLWIKDLSSPDALFTFKQAIPFLGNHFNLLPILMALGMFIQQKISMGQATVSGEAAQQQKIMSILMPIMFGVIFYQMPSGLVLYWFVNSILMLVYQVKIMKQK